MLKSLLLKSSVSSPSFTLAMTLCLYLFMSNFSIRESRLASSSFYSSTRSFKRITRSWAIWSGIIRPGTTRRPRIWPPRPLTLSARVSVYSMVAVNTFGGCPTLSCDKIYLEGIWGFIRGIAEDCWGSLTPTLWSRSCAVDIKEVYLPPKIVYSSSNLGG